MGSGITDETAVQRKRMVEEQLIGRGIRDKRVLDVMGKLPREKFVRECVKERSYFDGPLPIEYGQTISQPYIVAYMTEMLELSAEENVLELGTGSGYQTAVLAELSSEVYTVELIPELAENSEKLLKDELGYGNVHFRTGNGVAGWEEFAPFQKIIVTAAPEEFPELLFNQLDEGGIIITPVGRYFQNLVKYEKSKGEIIKTVLIAVSFVPFIV